MLTIGEFSRLCRVSPRMLRYYESQGLLQPETVGENGYRYYR
ncbi:MAG: MerR family DNA-binding transcriptional regulator, partial [Oscillospiraceae bacterium]|nr:MerR family DNA-binding transcriptional regulator [Oscillospiraceae bacterium]